MLRDHLGLAPLYPRAYRPGRRAPSGADHANRLHPMIARTTRWITCGILGLLAAAGAAILLAQSRHVFPWPGKPTPATFHTHAVAENVSFSSYQGKNKVFSLRFGAVEKRNRKLGFLSFGFSKVAHFQGLSLQVHPHSGVRIDDCPRALPKVSDDDSLLSRLFAGSPSQSRVDPSLTSFKGLSGVEADDVEIRFQENGERSLRVSARHASLRKRGGATEVLLHGDVRVEGPACRVSLESLVWRPLEDAADELRNSM